MSAPKIKVPLDRFTAWQHQAPIINAIERDGFKRAICVMHRRAGKDVAAFNLMVRMAFDKVGSYIYLLPTFSQGRRVIWQSVLNDGRKFLDFIPPQLILKKNEQEMRIVLNNGSEIYIAGSDSYDRLVGVNAVGLIFSEAAVMDERAWNYLKPIVEVNGGWALFISTPRGHNWFHSLFTIAKANPDVWFTYTQSILDTGLVDPKEIEEDIARGEISKDLAEQEYFCSFAAGAHGSFYSSYLDRMQLNEQIGQHVVYDPTKPVFTFWDIGVRDETAILFAQFHGRAVHIIEEYLNFSVGIEHYAEIIHKKGYRYGGHWGPHDLKVRDFSAGGATRLDIARRLGLNFNLAPNVGLEDGIEAVRALLSRTFINSKCIRLIQALENYRREYNEKYKRYSAAPVHDHHSHVADSIRYLAVSLPQVSAQETSMTTEQYRAMKQEAIYGYSSKGFDPFSSGTPRNF